MSGCLKRSMVLGLLVVGALLWTALMSVELFGGAGGDVAPHSGPDGEKVAITYIDQANFPPEIRVYLTVEDSSGQTISDIGQSGFALTEDGESVAPTDFVGSGNQPVTVILVIDHSGSMEDSNKMQGAKRAAKSFLSNMQTGRDSVGLIVFDNKVQTSFSLKLLGGNDLTMLNKKIDDLTAEGGTAFYDAVYAAVEQLDEQPGRKVVIALTDGKDEHSQRSLGSIARQAADVQVTVYTVGLGSRGQFNADSLAEMARETGGAYYHAPSSDELAALYQEIASSLQAEYSLAYSSPAPARDGTAREAAVTVSLPGGQAAAVKDYNPGGVLNPPLNLWVTPLFLIPLLLLLLMPGLVGRFAPRPAPEPLPPSQPDSPPWYVPPPSQPPPPIISQACPQCGRSLRPGAKFCPGCGLRLTCPSCGQAVRPGARFCKVCGNKFQGGN
jgi:VWFA-related protein